MLYECAICGKEETPFKGSSVSRIPLYACRTCYKEWICDENGIPRPYSEHPKWLKFLLSSAALSRQTKIGWKKRGINTDMVPFSDIQTTDSLDVIDLICRDRTKKGSVYS